MPQWPSISLIRISFRPIKGGAAPAILAVADQRRHAAPQAARRAQPAECRLLLHDQSQGSFVHGNSRLFAQLPPRDGDADDGSVSWGFDVPMNICSISKFITAIAMVRLLARHGDLEPSERIGNYLPQYWEPSPEVRALTFHDLMRHESGLGDGYDGSGAGNFAAPKPLSKQSTTGAGSSTTRTSTSRFCA